MPQAEQTGLFEGQARAPLARRMAPKSFDEFVGQEHLVGPEKPLRKLIENDILASLILWGPPGTGKSAVAGIVAGRTKAELVRLNAVTSTVDDLRHLKKEALGRRALGRRTIIFMDEIHRFNKAQQDALLPDVEDGLYILIGTTTHNPYFAITGALLSRSTIFQYHSLTKDQLLVILKRALQDAERGLGKENIQADDDALDTLAEFADGDGRAALTGLELCYLTLSNRTGPLKLSKAHVTESLQQKKLRYDRDEDEHYDTISAFIKSVRGSDPDAAIYWLAKMLAGGEDPRFISRRLMILASEDIGNAEPMGILVASAGMHVVETIGMPEAQITLAQVTAFLACSPKSNASYMAIAAAMKDVEEKPLMEVPKHLKDSHYKGAKSLGHGEGYEYPHSFEGAHVEQAYIPEPRKYYIPTDRGVEARFKEYLERIRKSPTNQAGT